MFVNLEQTTESAAGDGDTAMTAAATVRAEGRRTDRRGAIAAARQGATAVAAQAVYSGTSFLSTVILARLCDPDAFGVYYLAFTIALFAQGIQERLISTPYTIYCNRGGRDSAARYTGSVLLHQIVMSLLCSVGILALAAGIYFSGAMPGLAPVMVALAGMLPLLMLRSFVRQALIAHLDLTAAIVLDLAVAALQLGGLVALGAAGRLTAPVAYLVMGTACGVAVVAWFAIVRPSLSFSFSQSIADWRRNWAFAKWVVASNLAGSAAVYAVPWILGAVHDTAATALLGACLSLVGLANMFMAGLDSYLTPKAARSFAQRGLPGLTSVLWKSTAFIAILLSVMCVFFAVAGEPLAAIIYKGKYAGAGPIVTVLAVAVLINNLGNSAGRGLWILDRPRENLVPDAVLSVVTLAVFVVLVQPLGAFGAALATLAGNLVGAIVRTWSFAEALAAVRGEARLQEAP